MDNDQRVYLDYIQRRLESRLTHLDAPPYPFLIFTQMWNDRIYALEQDNQVTVAAIDYLLGDSSREMVRIGQPTGPAKPPVDIDLPPEYIDDSA